MAGSFRNEDRDYLEAVVTDNQFHRGLSNMRNKQVMDNHPDIELLKKESAQRQRKELTTFYNMSPVAEKEDKGSKATTKVVHLNPHPDLCDFDLVLAQLERETRRANKYFRPLSVFVVAFSDLLSLAALHGTDAYERALVFASAVVSSFLDKEIEIVGLYSTDRLLVVLPETHGPQATTLAENIRKFFQEVPLEHQRHRFYLKPSIGIACLPIHGRDWKELTAKADLAADAVLQAGGDGFGFGPQ